jgi:hypothetical protein
MAQRDLNLNSLGRYGKHSDRLILEEHGHCEIPAGCGGVILRWRNPNTGLNFLIQLFANGKCSFCIDGLTPTSGRPLISYGNHVLSLAISDIDPSQAVMALSAIHDESLFGFPRVSRPSNRKISILSTDDGSWRYSTNEPKSDAWMAPGFDDSNWPAMVLRDPPTFEQKDVQSYRLNAVLKSQAQCLGVDASSSRIWIRREFTISPS